MSILSNKTLRFSSMGLSNDSMEGWCSANLLREIISRRDVGGEDLILRISKNMVESIDCFAFCLSAARDLLSQWRGYANDGYGFSIGFSVDALRGVAQTIPHCSLEKVLYDKEEQAKALQEIFSVVAQDVAEVQEKGFPIGSSQDWMGGDLQVWRQSRLAMGNIYNKYEECIVPYLFLMKNDAFSEEEEWRIYRYGIKDDVRALDLPELSYRNSGNLLIPYFDVQFAGFAKNSIVEVLIGPKNKTPKYVVENLLHRYGFEDVIVNHSASTYR